VSRKVRPARKRIYPESTALQNLAPRRKAADETLLTVADVAHKQQISRGLVYVLLRSGELPSLWIRRLRRIRARDLDQFIRERWIGHSGQKAEGPPPNKKEPVEGRLAKYRREHGH